MRPRGDGTVLVPGMFVLVMTEGKHKGCSHYRGLARLHRGDDRNAMLRCQSLPTGNGN